MGVNCSNGTCNRSDGSDSSEITAPSNGKASSPGVGSFKELEDKATLTTFGVLDPSLDPSQNEYWLKKGVDPEMSTEDMHSVMHFTGEHKHIRPLLDYTYHKKYSEERVMMQDRIIHDVVKSTNTKDNLLLPWVIFTAGAMGAGKGYVMSWLEKQGCLPLDRFVTIDPDQIRSLLPEWDTYVKNDPVSAASKTQKEAGHIAEIMGYKALGSRWNVIFDGSLRDVAWYRVYFQKLRQTFPGIRLMILHINAEKEAVLKRAEERGKRTGRMVPRELLESSLDAVPKSVRALAPSVDVAIRVNNLENQEPQIEREAASLKPPPHIAITCNYLKQLWEPIDTDGDGNLSKEEVQRALANGKLTQDVVDTVDLDADGAITSMELKLAVRQCRQAAIMLMAGETDPHRSGCGTPHF